MLASHALLAPVFTISGLAFLAIVLAILLQRRGDSTLPLTNSLPYLGLFALLQGLAQWVNMISSLEGDGVNPDPLQEVLKAVLLGGSHLFLLWFGVDLLSRFRRDLRWARVALVLPLLMWVVASAGLVQWPPLQPYSWPNVVDATARYFLVLPGGILAVWGLHRHKRVFDDLGMPGTAQDCILAGVFLLSYTLLNGLITPPLPFFPASFANHHNFLLTIGVPVQLFRTFFAVGFALFVLRALRAYQEDMQRRLREAESERWAAQQEALDAQRRVEEQLRSWNVDLERKVQERTSELARRQLESEALYRVGMEIAADLKLDSILQSVVENSRSIIGADLAMAGLVDEGGHTIRLRASAGTRTDELGRLEMRVGEGLAGRVVATGEAALVADYLADERINHLPEVDAAVKAEGLRAHLAVPMKMGDEVTGVLSIASRSGRKFGQGDLWLLARLATLTAIAIQNSRLHERAQLAAVLEERERLSREIHDGVAQTLGYIGLISRAAQDRLERGRTGRVQDDLTEIERAAYHAYCDAREDILGLRVSSYGGRGLVSALRAYVARFNQQCGLDVRIAAHGSWPEVLPEETESQLVRIAQEALSNVRKHANATRVSIELSVQDGYGEVAVQDDGRGFDVARCGNPGATRSDGKARRTPGNCFGMQTMRERAEAIGGELLVRSAPGSGARVAVRFPMAGAPALQTPAAGPEVMAGWR